MNALSSWYTTRKSFLGILSVSPIPRHTQESCLDDIYIYIIHTVVYHYRIPMVSPQKGCFIMGDPQISGVIFKFTRTIQ